MFMYHLFEFLMLELLLSLLVHSSEQQIHDKNLPCDENRNEEDRIVLRLFTQLSYEFDQQSSVVNDLSKEDKFVEKQERKIALWVA